MGEPGTEGEAWDGMHPEPAIKRVSYGGDETPPLFIILEGPHRGHLCYRQTMGGAAQGCLIRISDLNAYRDLLAPEVSDG